MFGFTDVISISMRQKTASDLAGDLGRKGVSVKGGKADLNPSKSKFPTYPKNFFLLQSKPLIYIYVYIYIYGINFNDSQFISYFFYQLKKEYASNLTRWKIVSSDKLPRWR